MRTNEMAESLQLWA